MCAPRSCSSTFGGRSSPRPDEPTANRTAQEAWLTVDMLKSGTRIAGIEARVK
jgi:hypothetical protein